MILAAVCVVVMSASFCEAVPYPPGKYRICHKVESGDEARDFFKWVTKSGIQCGWETECKSFEAIERPTQPSKLESRLCDPK